MSQAPIHPFQPMQPAPPAAEISDRESAFIGKFIAVKQQLGEELHKVIIGQDAVLDEMAERPVRQPVHDRQRETDDRNDQGERLH